jgi:hypothetical protein
MSDDVTATAGVLEDIPAEGDRLVVLAESRGILLRVAGGAGIALRSATARSEPFMRAYADLDFAARASDRRPLTDLLAESGYIPDKVFNATHGARRLYFWDTAHGRQVDVFLDKFEMCHQLELKNRLHLPGPSLNAADLLLMKLQIFEANEKDLLDIAALTAGVPITDDEAGIDMAYILSLTSNDWGLWRTTTMIAERARDYASGLKLPAGALSVEKQLEDYLHRVRNAPKTRRWNLRAKIGERKRWYELPEEEEH